MDIKIETATLDILDTLYGIEKQSFKREAFTKQHLEYLLTDYNAIGLVARVNGEIVGFVIARIEVAGNTPFGHIFTLDVTPSQRRKGIAQRLLLEIETLLRERSIKECRLEVRENNLAAISLYLKTGYEKIDKLEKYYGDAHGLYLKKNL